MCFFNLAEHACLQRSESFSSWKILICMKKYFQKVTQFSQGNNVLHATASNRHGFLWVGAYVSSSQLNRPIWSKQNLSPPRNRRRAGSSLFKKILNSHWEIMC